jgi:hypothetical protein
MFTAKMSPRRTETPDMSAVQVRFSRSLPEVMSTFTPDAFAEGSGLLKAWLKADEMSDREIELTVAVKLGRRVTF